MERKREKQDGQIGKDEFDSIIYLILHWASSLRYLSKDQKGKMIHKNSLILYLSLLYNCIFALKHI